MPFDKLDKKIQEAAEQYNPAYNEDSWSKMEALLDEHMPINREEKRKFPAGWIFLLLFIMAGSFVMLLIKPGKTNKENKEAANVEKTNSGIKDHANNNSNRKDILQVITPQKKNSPGNKLNRQNLLLVNTFNKEAIKKESSAGTNSLQYTYPGPAMELVNKDDINTATSVKHNGELLITSGFEHKVINDMSIDREKLFAKNISVNKSITRDSNTSLNKKPNLIRKNKFDDLFSLNFSMGPDVSAVNINNIGTAKLLLGAGMGYSFGKNWQVKTGIYAVKKVYEAKPSDYHPPTDFWTYYPHLDDVNADCNVIEVPLILNYKFSQHSKQVWFASAGLSSYFMKKERYNYQSKIAPGQYQVKSLTIKNQNKHYLSSLRISAGYEKNLNKTISLSAEPYLNLPLSGVGFGKVKLSSAGLLFSVSVKPFIKKNK